MFFIGRGLVCARKNTSSLEQVTDTVLDEVAVQADLEKYAFFAIESLPGQFD